MFDRFQEMAMGVKRAYRPDWLDSENTIFINKLNFVTEHFEDAHRTVEQLKSTVFTEHKNRFDEFELRVRDNSEQIYQLRLSLQTLESNLPQMVREMVDYYGEHKLSPKLEAFVPKAEYKETVGCKLDYVVFNEFVKRQQQAEQANTKEFKTDERLFTIEKKMEGLVKADDFKALMKHKASNERLAELRETVQKLNQLVSAYYESQ